MFIFLYKLFDAWTRAHMQTAGNASEWEWALAPHGHTGPHTLTGSRQHGNVEMNVCEPNVNDDLTVVKTQELHGGGRYLFISKAKIVNSPIAYWAT